MIPFLFSVLWLLLIPFCCGLCITKYLPEQHHNYRVIFLNGYLTMIAFFQCIYLCFVIMGNTSFYLLTWVFAVFISLFALFSLWWGRKVIKRSFQLKIPKEARLVGIVFVIMVVLQLGLRLVQQVSDGDDAFYIATALATETSNTMNRIQPYTGYVTEDLDMRHAFSSAPVWLAFLSKMTRVHPAIMGHSVLSLVLILLHYMVVLECGKVLLKDKKREGYLFGCIVSLFNVFGYVSIYTPQTFFLTRTWQGKSIFANLFLPMIFLLLLWIGDREKKQKASGFYFVLGTLVLFASTAMTTMGAFIMPLVFCLGMCWIAVCYKKPVFLFQAGLSCIPTILVGVIYLLMS